MTLDEIQSEWAKDAVIDISELHIESIRSSVLHSKYFNLLQKSRLTVNRLEIDLKSLKLQKKTFFMQRTYSSDYRLRLEDACKGKSFKG